MNQGTVWVIGASSGLGLATAQALAASGWLVVSGARSFAVPSNEKGVHMLSLDVTLQQSREAFVTSALALSPRVDALVYCAAVLVLGACEHTDYAAYDNVMKTNFLGLTAMVSLAMPQLRAQESGKIVLFSSINGLLGIPFQSAYTASKHAIEGYAECLAMEAAPFGIQVCLVEPGDHRGGSQHTRLHVGAPAHDPYADAYRKACAVIHRDETGGLLPDRLGRKVARAMGRRRMPFRLLVAKPDQRLAVLIHRLFPIGVNFAILRDYYGKGGHAQ